MNKKYYWLKLKDDFFANKEIKKFRKVAGGDTYIIIYLKMLLVSIKNGGIIEYDRIEKNISAQLALELDEDIDNIKMVLSFMKENNLIEGLSENEYLLTKVPTLIGKETNAAERMRKMRDRNNVTGGDIGDVTLLRKSTNKTPPKSVGCNIVTPVLQNVTQREEIEKERRDREKIKEPKKSYGEFKNVFLSDVNHKKCIDNYGLYNTNKAIEKLSSFKESNGKKYKSDYAAMNQWVWGSIDATRQKKSEIKRTYIQETITEEERKETERLLAEVGGIDNLFKGKIKNLRGVK